MTEFAIEVRHYCRNPKCRSKLKATVENPREAFCARGCHSAFYRKRCRVCEEPMERKTENQKVCGKRIRLALVRRHQIFAGESFRDTSCNIPQSV